MDATPRCEPAPPAHSWGSVNQLPVFLAYADAAYLSKATLRDILGAWGKRRLCFRRLGATEVRCA